MKIFKIILVSLLIFLIAFGIPYIIHNNIYIEKYYTKVDGPMRYYNSIIEDENATSDIKQNAIFLMNEESYILKGQKEDFILLLLIVGIILSVTIILIGLLLKKLTDCQIPYISFIISGTLTGIAYLILYYMDVGIYYL